MPEPRKNTLIGITHLSDGTKLIKESKVLKVGVGLPRGKAVDVFVDNDGKWNIRAGKAVAGSLKFDTVAKVDTRAEAEAAWKAAYRTADLCGYPRKVPYFVFTRPVVGQDGSEIYVPDFAATEAYSFADPARPGAPTEIDIIFLNDDCYTMQYAMWAASGLQCSGDGENATRLVQMYPDAGKVPESLREAWKVSQAAGARYFPVEKACWTCNCPYAKERDKKAAPCKPSGDLRFQLIKNIRVGGTAYFHTGGIRSIIQIFSAIERIKELTGGRIAGIPLKFVLRPYKTNHNGQPSLQSGVSIEFRAEDMESVRKNLIEQAQKFKSFAELDTNEPPKVRLLDAPEEQGIESVMSGEAMVNEFYTDPDDEENEGPSATPEPVAAAVTSNKVTDIGERLAAQIKQQKAPETAAAVDEPAF